MDKSLIEQYKTEMLNMYKPNKTVSTQAAINNPNNEDVGGIVAVVTTLRKLYPVPNAKVTIFTGNIEDKQIIATDITDQSGKTDVIKLKTPSIEESQQAGINALPYASYNMLVEADGYIDNIHLNIPVFSGVTSIQNSNMMLLEAAGVDKDAQIFNEQTDYNL